MSKPIEVTEEMVEAGIDALTCKFGGPSENPAVDYEAAAVRVFSEMLRRAIHCRIADGFLSISAIKALEETKCERRDSLL